MCSMLCSELPVLYRNKWATFDPVMTSTLLVGVENFTYRACFACSNRCIKTSEEGILSFLAALDMCIIYIRAVF
jgi:hypothetical protein